MNNTINSYSSVDIAQKIKEICQKRGVSAAEMLRDLKLGSNTISMLLHGRAPSAVTLARVADYLDVSTDYLLGRACAPEDIYLGGIARNIANACTECGITVPELLSACGLPDDTLKRAQAENISAVDMAKIAARLGRSVEQLLSC